VRTELLDAVRGVLAAVSLLAFVGLFLALEARIASLPLLLALLAVGTGTLLAAGGRPAFRRLLGRGEAVRDEDGGASDAGAEGDAWLDEAGDVTPWTDRSDRAGGDREPDPALARLEPALDDAWNRWSDVALTVGLAVLGVALAWIVPEP